MTLDDFLKALAGLLVLGGWAAEHLRNRKGHKELREEVRKCEKDADRRDRECHKQITQRDTEIDKLHVRLSAFETEMVALRNLLPGGKWHDSIEAERLAPDRVRLTPRTDGEHIPEDVEYGPRPRKPRQERKRENE